jgi:hypothetical protein
MSIDTTIGYDERFDKIDTQFQEMRDQFKTVNDQLDKITTVVVKGFDRIDNSLDE